MGLFDRFKSRKPAPQIFGAERPMPVTSPAVAPIKKAEPQVAPVQATPPPVQTAPPGPTFAVWVDPPVSPPTEEWERRLNAYAKKCARELTAAGVPLFRAEWPYSGENRYRDAFWLIACDVEVAERSRVVMQADHILGVKRQPGSPPEPRRGCWSGWIIGKALLLTQSGLWCVADAWGAFSCSDTIANHEADIAFTNIMRSADVVSHHQWGWVNKGKWRRNPNGITKIYGTQVAESAIRFEEAQYYTGNNPGDGRGTSAALSNFVKTNGQTRWPRGFIVSGF